MNPETVKIKDSYLVSFLMSAKHYPIASEPDPNGRIVWFIFENSSDLQERLLAFSINQPVPIQDFISNLRRTREIIFNCKGGRQPRSSEG
jgi:hypothetical protein